MSEDDIRRMAIELYEVGLHSVGPDDLDNRELAKRLLTRRVVRLRRGWWHR